VRIDIDVPPGAVTVGADEAVVERLLAPLIENGCRYAVATVRVSAHRVDGEVRLAVDDDGPGVDASVRERLFEPGVHAPAGNGAGSGAGLGLALARRLARALGGDVEYERGSGTGGRFCVRLPAV
jgi:signal transduction histidine kinase